MWWAKAYNGTLLNVPMKIGDISNIYRIINKTWLIFLLWANAMIYISLTYHQEIKEEIQTKPKVDRPIMLNLPDYEECNI